MIQNTVSQLSVTAQNTFSPAMGVGQNKKVSISVTGTFSATIVVQRKLLGALDATYADVFSTTAPVQKIMENAGKWVYRIGCKTGGFTSGTAVCVLAY